MWIHNVYNPSPRNYDSTTSPSTIPEIAPALERPGEHILLGDFNLHHPEWNNQGRYTYHAAADQLLEATLRKEMSLALPENSVTWKARRSESAIDLAFLTPAAYHAMINCRVRIDLQYGSDHRPIVTELEWGWEKPPVAKRRAWKKLQEESIQKEVDKGSKALRSTLGTPDLLTKTQIDAYLDKIMGGFNEIVELTVPWAKPSKKARSFWNADCARVVKKAKQCLRDYHSDNNEYTKEALRLAEREKNSIIDKAKTLDFRQGVHKASKTPAGVWKLAKWGRERSMLPKELPQFPSLRDSATKSMVSTFEGKVKILRETFFPPPITADLSDIATASYPVPITTSQKIEEKEIAKAIRRPAPDKAPGISGIPNRFLRAVLPNLGGCITHLFQACWNLGYHPRKFKEANTIILKKPKKKTITPNLNPTARSPS